MHRMLDKIQLTLKTYRQARSAIARQYDLQKLIEVQNRKLRQVIKYSASNIKYYQELFDQAGVDPAQIKTRQDLSVIPILTKQQLRDRFWDFLPRHLPPCQISRTSGSTGVPVCILSDSNSRCFNSAGVIRYRKALGVPFIGGSILTPMKNEHEKTSKPHWTYLQGIHKTYSVNPYSESSEDIRCSGKLLAKLEKPILIGITPALRKLAYAVRDGTASCPALCPVSY